MTVSITTLDAARAVVRLDEYALLGKGESVDIDGVPWNRDELRHAVARNLSEQYRRAVGGMGASRGVKASDVRGMLIALGASSLTLDHARAIARMIREDFSL